MKQVVRAVRNAGGNVVAVGVMVNRSPEIVNSETIGAPFSPLSELPADAYDEKDCPLCRDNVPINTSIGHGRKYLEQKNASS